MTIETIMVHVDIHTQNEALFACVADLAVRLNARLIGIAACQPLQVPYYGEPHVMADVFEEDRVKLEASVKQAEAQFRSAFQHHAREIEWRATITYGSIADYIAREARAADLIVIDPENFSDRIDASRRLNVEDFVMQVGRPILLTAKHQQKLTLDHVLVGWKDSPEAQRALTAALPLLRHAGLVTVAEIATSATIDQSELRVKDVALYLKHHGVTAEARTVWQDGDAATQLTALAQDLRAGLVVGGAFGHSRLREWVFGGVTRDLLLHPAGYSTLLMH